MKETVAAILVVGAILTFMSGCMSQKELLALNGPYVGQSPPRGNPEIFAPDIITTPYHEHSSPEFSPDGKEVYWSVFFNFWGPQVILMMNHGEHGWSAPEVAPFSGQYSDGNPCFSPKGKRLFFESSRPMPNVDSEAYDLNLWFVERQDDGWSEPKPMGLQVNTPTWERGPSISNNENLYFTSMRQGGYGGTDIYVARYVNGIYMDPTNLGPNINTEGHESWPFIDSDERYLLFESATGNIFISFRQEDASWSETTDLGDLMQSTARQDRFPKVSRDGLYFFFVSNRWLGSQYPDRPLSIGELKRRAGQISNGMGNVFWMDASPIADLLP